MEKALAIVDPNQPVDYSSTIVPTNYHCHECKVTGVKLWREYHTVLDNQTLLCVTCSGKEQGKDVSSIDDRGCITSEASGKTDQIGWRVPAVLNEENTSFWGYTSVPDAGVNYWKRLPVFRKE